MLIRKVINSVFTVKGTNVKRQLDGKWGKLIFVSYILLKKSKQNPTPPPLFSCLPLNSKM